MLRAPKCLVSPTVFHHRGYRLYFFSREESRPHVHVEHETGRAKFWLSPSVTLAVNRGLRPHRLSIAQRLIEDRIDEILTAWQAHLPG